MSAVYLFESTFILLKLLTILFYLNRKNYFYEKTKAFLRF